MVEEKWSSLPRLPAQGALLLATLPPLDPGCPCESARILNSSPFCHFLAHFASTSLASSGKKSGSAIDQKRPWAGVLCCAGTSRRVSGV